MEKERIVQFLSKSTYNMKKEHVNMSKKGYSRPGLFGTMNHYDENGHKTGHSDKGIFGGWNHFDE